MSDLNQILAGTVDEVTKALAPLTADQLAELKALEEADKNRKGVLTAIEAALVALADAASSSISETIEQAAVTDETAILEDPEVLASVGEALVFDAPAIMIEPITVVDPQIIDEPILPEMPAAQPPVIELPHPALDADLRAGTTAEQNRIDFNDPFQGGREVVEAALAAQIEG